MLAMIRAGKMVAYTAISKSTKPLRGVISCNDSSHTHAREAFTIWADNERSERCGHPARRTYPLTERCGPGERRTNGYVFFQQFSILTCAIINEGRIQWYWQRLAKVVMNGHGSREQEVEVALGAESSSLRHKAGSTSPFIFAKKSRLVAWYMLTCSDITEVHPST